MKETSDQRRVGSDNLPSKMAPTRNGLAYALYGMGITSSVVGVVVSASGAVHPGAVLVGVGVVLFVSTAVWLRHLTIW